MTILPGYIWMNTLASICLVNLNLSLSILVVIGIFQRILYNYFSVLLDNFNFFFTVTSIYWPSRFLHSMLDYTDYLRTSGCLEIDAGGSLYCIKVNLQLGSSYSLDFTIGNLPEFVLGKFRVSSWKPDIMSFSIWWRERIRRIRVMLWYSVWMIKKEDYLSRRSTI